MKKIYLLAFMCFMLVCKTTAQQVNLTGKVLNPDEKPIEKVLVYLANNPALQCYSDSLGYFSLTDQLSTSVPENRQNEIISLKNGKLYLYADNQSLSIDVITLIGIPIINILNQSKSTGTFELYPEAYIAELPKAIYIVRAKVGGTVRSFKIQNIIPTSFSKGTAHYNTNNIVANAFSKPKSILKTGVSDTLVLVHEFYKSRKMPLSTYTVQYDTIHLNNFADYTLAEGFEPSVTYCYNGYANFTNIYSKDSAQFIIDYDTLSILKGDLTVIAIPVDKIESLDISIKYITGLHFEPSGTKFIQPAQVTVLMKDTIPENLVVFQCNDQGMTYFIPYVSHILDDGYCIVFNINHFSSIGIGNGVVPSTNPEGFTTSDQFISYLAQYVNNFDAVPEGIFTLWFNNVVVPMINKIVTYEDLCAALGEFGIIGKNFILSGGNSINDLPCYYTAMEMFCNKMTKIWNDCVAQYKELDEYCSKREILKIALNILALNQLNGDICSDFSQSDLNDFGNGEYFNLAQKIEFAKQIKHLEAGESYVVEYALKSISGDPIPEIVVWTSSNPSVASINTEGKVIANSDGEAIITGKICDIENSFNVNVGGANCEKYYCYNEYGNCYSRTNRYKCTGVVRITRTGHDYCGSSVWKWVERFTIVNNLDDHFGEYQTIETFRHENYWMGKKCGSSYSVENDTFKDPYSGYFGCSNTSNYFYYIFSTFHSYVQAHGPLKGDLLNLDVRYNSGDAGTKYTKFFCTCIGK